MSSSSSHKYVALLALAFQTVSALPSKYHSPNPRSILKRAADGPWFTDFADPGIVQADDGLYAYSTQSGPHIPTAFSTDIAGPWNYLQHNNGNTLDALPTRPSWYPDGCDVYWAPNVFAPVSEQSKHSTPPDCCCPVQLQQITQMLIKTTICRLAEATTCSSPGQAAPRMEAVTLAPISSA